MVDRPAPRLGPISASQLLFTQGFGSRRECAALIGDGQLEVGGKTIGDPDTPLDPSGLVFHVQQRAWPWTASALLLLHKPAGYECSQRPRHHLSVMSLLPAPLRRRGVQPVGRLDEDTTGLLLLTDDGALIHRLTSPKSMLPKVYQIVTKHPATPAQAARLCQGVVLDDDPQAVRAAACECTASHTMQLTLTQGKYHQVKRMVAAAGNRVSALHRSAFGNLDLPPDLAPGQWRWVGDEQRAQLAGEANRAPR